MIARVMGHVGAEECAHSHQALIGELDLLLLLEVPWLSLELQPLVDERKACSPAERAEVSTFIGFQLIYGYGLRRHDGMYLEKLQHITNSAAPIERFEL